MRSDCGYIQDTTGGVEAGERHTLIHTLKVCRGDRDKQASIKRLPKKFLQFWARDDGSLGVWPKAMVKRDAEK